MAARVEAERLIAMGVYAHQRNEVRALIRGVLGKYGQPKMPLAKLREELSKQVRGTSLSEFIIREREGDDPRLR